MSDALQTAALSMPLVDPVEIEEPREGDPGGAPCGYCAVSDRDTVWSNKHWQVVPRSWSPIPGGMLLLSRAYTDTLNEMVPERQAEFGSIAAAIERAILTLGGVARVHLSVRRWLRTFPRPLRATPIRPTAVRVAEPAILGTALPASRRGPADHGQRGRWHAAKHGWTSAMRSASPLETQVGSPPRANATCGRYRRRLASGS
jgi:hypothetical protein